MSESLADVIQRAILAHLGGETGMPLWQALEEAIRKQFDVRRRPEWTSSRDPVTLAPEQQG